ncbi:MAG: AmmeMemoRadiSam system radical SAM enzyme [Candidatus Omnitrophota bacterium]
MAKYSVRKKLILTGMIITAILISGLISLFPPPKTFSRVIPIDKDYLKEALWWKTACNGVQCVLCPFRCFLPEGQRGICRVRINCSGRLLTLVYGQPASMHVDPIEKKPVYHMLPGSKIFSIATVGCNLRCRFCQNWSLSQTYPEQTKKLPFIPSDKIVDEAIRTECDSIAYTYSEPIVFYEYVLDIAKLAKKNGLRNVLVSAGYINPEPLELLARYFDVIKIDLKGFNERFYADVVGGDLSSVKQTLITLKQKGVLVEVVNLVVPSLNDDVREIRQMCEWIHDNLGPDTPLFFSRFSPQYQLTNLPPTPAETLKQARDIAMDSGLNYVYIGNMPGDEGEDTYCSNCKRVLINRYGYHIQDYHIKDGRCEFCSQKIPGIWR